MISLTSKYHHLWFSFWQCYIFIHPLPRGMLMTGCKCTYARISMQLARTHSVNFQFSIFHKSFFTILEITAGVFFDKDIFSHYTSLEHKMWWFRCNSVVNTVMYTKFHYLNNLMLISLLIINWNLSCENITTCNFQFGTVC